MPSNPETIIHDIQMEFDSLIDFVAGERACTAQVYVSGACWAVALGRQLLTLWLCGSVRSHGKAGPEEAVAALSQ